ncbi:MAG: alanine--tRNA ligase [Bacteroidia bacterium]|jgi:alanyl-tRNA synthetase
MTAAEVRETFLKFFEGKGHTRVSSAPIVVKNDPTLMFTNAGMNQFKDWFLGNETPKYKRVVDTQKCLRVSGKHNDLEEVGVDTYHHTMFEMLGNWSFGDYFKEEAIAWAWELLTEVYKLPKDRLYVTVFEGDAKEGLAFDQEAYDNWAKWIDTARILNGNKKDNFWEMGDTGPCGPCSEIHIDLRTDVERKAVDGKTLVNNDHPQVIEIWNNVFMEFNRKADSSLEKLPAQHVDTGMGFERLVRAIEGKSSNYDTDVFVPTIQFIEQHAGIAYGFGDSKTDIAMRVMADHIRAISFAIADGQLPSNNGAGYVIRRILRRAVRYQYQFLNLKEPFLCKLAGIIAESFKNVFPELNAQRDFVVKVIREEEQSFLRTLEKGIDRIAGLKQTADKVIAGPIVFELYDTYGFPPDLTKLVAAENGFGIDEAGFESELQKQKARSRKATELTTDDWVVIGEENPTEFLGYVQTEAEVKISKYRKVKAKGKDNYQLVFDRTPFYPEGGGQIGDTGKLFNANETIEITDTKKENNLIIHFTNRLPENVQATFNAEVDAYKRQLTENNHSATHLLHAALRSVLGTHVQQKGSLVNNEYLRFDFAHFSAMTEEEIKQVEQIVNQKIRENILLDERRQVPIEEARQLGAMMLFGEKYGETVRVITFDEKYSRELCGGTHVKATGQIGLFKIVSEGAVAAGVRRIEAITADAAEEAMQSQWDILHKLKTMLTTKDVLKSMEQLLAEKQELQKKLELFESEKTSALKIALKSTVLKTGDVNVLIAQVDIPNADQLKNLSFQLKQDIENLYCVLGCVLQGKPMLSIIISDNLVTENKWNAGQIIKELAKEIGGGGGGQPFYATAGGTRVEGLVAALEKAKQLPSAPAK